MQLLCAKGFCGDSIKIKRNVCMLINDTLTGKTVFVSTGALPENEGGPEYFAKKIMLTALDSIPPGYDGHFIVAFIVDTTGNSYGERIVKAPILKTGIEIINIIKIMKWKQAICNGAKVDMLYVKDIYLDVGEE